MHAPSLLHALDIRPGSFVAIIGAGGKSACLLALAHSLRAAGKPALMTTTTKMWPRQDIPLILRDAGDDSEMTIREGLLSSGVAMLAAGVTSEGKLSGVPADDLCRLRERLGTVTILCEADGAAGRPLKAHASHEPVVPACATHLVVVAGLDAVGKPVREAVHRPEIFSDLFGAATGARIEPADVASALGEASRYAPAGSRIAFVLNKADSAERRALAETVSDQLQLVLPDAPVIATRHAVPARVFAPI